MKIVIYIVNVHRLSTREPSPFSLSPSRYTSLAPTLTDNLFASSQPSIYSSIRPLCFIYHYHSQRQ